VLAAATLWLFYMALEPYVRRLWPEMLISWNRVLAGRWRDPQVGRDLLVGSLGGVGMAVTVALGTILPAWLGRSPHWPRAAADELLLGTRHVAGRLLQEIAAAIMLGLFYGCFLVVLRVTLRRRWLAAVALALLLTIAYGYLNFGGVYASDFLLACLGSAALVVGLFRLGLFAIMVGLFASMALLDFGAGYSPPAWYGGDALYAVAIVAAVAFFGFWTTLAGRPLWRDDLLRNA
jgi:hypothetical protein